MCLLQEPCMGPNFLIRNTVAGTLAGCFEFSKPRNFMKKTPKWSG